MTTAIIITICALLLIAYLFDLTAARTRIPSVILLLFVGWGVGQISDVAGVTHPNLQPLLAIFGTIGLILIVLEGSLELEMNRSKKPVILKSLLVATLPLLGLAFLLAGLFQYFGGVSFQSGLVNAIPICVISSAVAIPSAKNLSTANKEFVVYESSLSDIVGVLFFNFVALNETYGLASIGEFSLQLVVMTVVSFAATLGLVMLLGKIDHHIKHGPIILLIILIYAVSKVYHLPSLIFILIFGLLLGNIDEFKHVKWISRLKTEQFDTDVARFKELTAEATFIVRALFFLLFGYLMQTEEILNPETFKWALSIVVLIFGIRAAQLRLARLPLRPLLFIAPRGLITILLFLSIPLNHEILLVNRSLIIQIIVITALVMMMGMMLKKKEIKLEH